MFVATHWGFLTWLCKSISNKMCCALPALLLYWFHWHLDPQKTWFLDNHLPLECSDRSSGQDLVTLADSQICIYLPKKTTDSSPIKTSLRTSLIKTLGFINPLFFKIIIQRKSWWIHLWFGRKFKILYKDHEEFIWIKWTLLFQVSLGFPRYESHQCLRFPCGLGLRNMVASMATILGG